MDYKKENLSVYNAFSNYFKVKFEEYTNQYIKDELEKINALIPRHSQILDIGCGSGDHAIFLKQEGHDVLCLDISDSFLEICEQRGLKTIKMDFEKLDFQKNSFDVVWAYTSLLHVPKTKMKNILDNIHQIVKTNGLLVISVKEGKGEGFAEFEKGGRRWFSLYEKEEIVNLLSSKFKILDSWKVSTTNGKTFLDFVCKRLS